MQGDPLISGFRVSHSELVRKGFELSNHGLKVTLASGIDALNRSPSGGDSSTSFRGLRTLLTHDWLINWAGSERVLKQILQAVPGAVVASAFVDREVVRTHLPHQDVRELWLGRLPGARRHYQWLLPLEAAAFRTLDTSDYDLVISSSHALAKTVSPGRLGIHVCYCYSPPRYLWDLHATYMASAGWSRRVAMGVGRRGMQAIDRYSARQVTHFLCLSQYVAERIWRVYGRRARVIYPPVAQKKGNKARDGEREEFLLYLGRLVPYKRVDLLVEAARLHSVRTIIAGEGPERDRLEAMAGGNVEFLGHVSEEEAGELLSRCAAFLFCAEEDFGIAPLEANAHGAPVVAYRGGAILETMVEGVTAEFFDHPTPDELARAVRRALSRPWDRMALQNNAGRFSAGRFHQEFVRAVENALSGESW